MLKFLLYRALPIGAAVGIFSSALSPLQPMLSAFGKAASALAGDTSTGGVDVQPPDLRGELEKVKTAAQGPKKASAQGRRLQELAAQLDQGGAATDPDDPYGHHAGARGPKPIVAPPPAPRRK